MSVWSQELEVSEGVFHLITGCATSIVWVAHLQTVAKDNFQTFDGSKYFDDWTINIPGGICTKKALIKTLPYGDVSPDTSLGMDL